MAGRRRASGTSSRNTSPAAKAAATLDKQIATAERKAGEYDSKAKEQRDSIEPLKAAREALGNVSTPAAS